MGYLQTTVGKLVTGRALSRGPARCAGFKTGVKTPVRKAIAAFTSPVMPARDFLSWGVGANHRQRERS